MNYIPQIVEMLDLKWNERRGCSEIFEVDGIGYKKVLCRFETYGIWIIEEHQTKLDTTLFEYVLSGRVKINKLQDVSPRLDMMFTTNEMMFG